MKNDFGSVFCDETLHSFTISTSETWKTKRVPCCCVGKLELEIENTGLTLIHTKHPLRVVFQDLPAQFRANGACRPSRGHAPFDLLPHRFRSISMGSTEEILRANVTKLADAHPAGDDVLKRSTVLTAPLLARRAPQTFASVSCGEEQHQNSSRRAC